MLLKNEKKNVNIDNRFQYSWNPVETFLKSVAGEDENDSFISSKDNNYSAQKSRKEYENIISKDFRIDRRQMKVKRKREVCIRNEAKDSVQQDLSEDPNEGWEKFHYELPEKEKHKLDDDKEIISQKDLEKLPMDEPKLRSQPVMRRAKLTVARSQVVGILEFLRLTDTNAMMIQLVFTETAILASFVLLNVSKIANNPPPPPAPRPSVNSMCIAVLGLLICKKMSEWKSVCMEKLRNTITGERLIEASNDRLKLDCSYSGRQVKGSHDGGGNAPNQSSENQNQETNDIDDGSGADGIENNNSGHNSSGGGEDRNNPNKKVDSSNTDKGNDNELMEINERSGGGSGGTKDHGGGSGRSTDPGGGSGRSTDPGGCSGRSTDPGGGLGRSTDPGGGSGRSTDPGGCSGRSTDPGGCSGRSTDPGGCSGRSTDPGGCSGRSTDPGGGSGRSTDPGGGSGRSTDPGGCSGRSTDSGGSSERGVGEHGRLSENQLFLYVGHLLEECSRDSHSRNEIEKCFKIVIAIGDKHLQWCTICELLAGFLRHFSTCTGGGCCRQCLQTSSIILEHLTNHDPTCSSQFCFFMHTKQKCHPSSRQLIDISREYLFPYFPRPRKPPFDGLRKVNGLVCSPTASAIGSLLPTPLQKVSYGSRQELLERSRLWTKGKSYDEQGVILQQMKSHMKIQNAGYTKNVHWRQLSHLGSGRSGKCFLAQDSATEFNFCVKQISLAKYEPSEIDIQSSLNHKFIVKLYGALVRASDVLIFTEFIDGESLLKHIERQKKLKNKFGQWMSLHYTSCLLQTQKYMQENGVLHEDLKADNILLKNCSTSIALTDFGLARRLKHDEVIEGESPVGAQTHWSPEKASSQGHCFPADVWAVMCILVHIVSTEHPWLRRYSTAAALHILIVEQSPPLKDIPESISSVVKDLIKKGWTLDPQKRPTAEQLLQHPAFEILKERPNPPENLYSVLKSDDNLDLLHQSKISQEEQTMREIIENLPQENECKEEKRSNQQATTTIGSQNSIEHSKCFSNFHSDNRKPANVMDTENIEETGAASLQMYEYPEFNYPEKQLIPNLEIFNNEEEQMEYNLPADEILFPEFSDDERMLNDPMDVDQQCLPGSGPFTPEERISGGRSDDIDHDEKNRILLLYQEQLTDHSSKPNGMKIRFMDEDGKELASYRIRKHSEVWSTIILEMGHMLHTVGYEKFSLKMQGGQIVLPTDSVTVQNCSNFVVIVVKNDLENLLWWYEENTIFYNQRTCSSYQCASS